MLTDSIVLIDDHALFRCGLRMVLQANMPHADIVEAGSLEEAIRLELPAPSLVLLDVQLHGLSGIEGMALLRRKWGQTPIIVLSADGADHTARDARERGAADFVSKSESAEQILRVIARVLEGTVEPPAAAEHLPLSEQKQALTLRQYEVLDLLSQGMTNKAIGRRLNLSENTIRGHVQAILQALEVDNRSEAAFAARRRGLVR